MALSESDIARLGKTAQLQIDAARKAREKDRRRQEQVKSPPSAFDSQLEHEFYFSQVYPKLQSGAITVCEPHKTFELLPAREYCGIKMRPIRYTPDFYLEYQSGYIEVVEVKHQKIKQLRPDYAIRRRMFIELIAVPRGWGFRELITKD